MLLLHATETVSIRSVEHRCSITCAKDSDGSPGLTAGSSNFSTNIKQLAVVKDVFRVGNGNHGHRPCHPLAVAKDVSEV